MDNDQRIEELEHQVAALTAALTAQESSRSRRSGRTQRLVFSTVAGLCLALLLGTVALAAIPGAGGVITGCYDKRTGALRVIDSDAGQKCTSKETQLPWNQTGIQGPQGEGVNTLLFCPQCDMTGADLSGQDRRGAYLPWARLTNGSLAGTRLEHANLRRTSLENTDLSGTLLSGADLSGAIGIPLNADQAEYNATTCPDLTNSQDNGGTCVGHFNIEKG
jgi:hypothetical protein